MPVLVRHIAPWAVQRKFADAFLRQHTHIDLEAHQREHGQREHGQNDHVAQILHRLNDGTDDGFQARHNGNGLQSAQHTKRAQRGQIAEIDAHGYVAVGCGIRSFDVFREWSTWFDVVNMVITHARTSRV